MVVAGRSHAGFNPASGPDVKLFGAVLDGNHVVRGFRNADIREALYGTTEDPVERRRQSHAVGRMLKRLHVRGLIVKVPRSRRWHVSPKDIECSKAYSNSITAEFQPLSVQPRSSLKRCAHGAKKLPR